MTKHPPHHYIYIAMAGGEVSYTTVRCSVSPLEGCFLRWKQSLAWLGREIEQFMGTEDGKRMHGWMDADAAV